MKDRLRKAVEDIAKNGVDGALVVVSLKRNDALMEEAELFCKENGWFVKFKGIIPVTNTRGAHCTGISLVDKPIGEIEWL